MTARLPLPALLLALALAAAFAPTASAAPLEEELWTACNDSALLAEDGSPIPLPPAGQRCDIPRGVAADPDRGHVYVADQANRRIVDYNALGQFVRMWGWDVVESGPGEDTEAPEDEFEICVPGDGDECKSGLSGGGPGQFSAALGVAIDSGGNVYAVDFSNRRVQKFDRKGNLLLAFGEEGTGNGQFGAWAVGDFIAVDRNETATDADDSVYVGDEGRFQRFDVEGAYQDECSVPGTVQSLDVDASGDLYLQYSGESKARKMTPPPACGLLAEPTFEIPIPDEFTTLQPTALTVDTRGHVFAFSSAATGNGFVPLDRIYEFDEDGELLDQFGKQQFGSSTGLATNLCEGSEAPGNLYVTNISGPGVPHLTRAYGTDPIGCFRARTLPADPIAETTATLNGTVNPKGEAVEACFFEYGTTTTYGEPPIPCAEYEEGSEWKSLTSPEAQLTGTEPTPVRSPVEGLDTATTYHFRLTADIGGETEPGADERFKTLGPPVISEAHVLGATETEATLKALVNPEGLPTECHFQYTTQAAFDAEGFEGAESTPEQAIDEDRAEHAFSALLADLAPGTAYRWRALCDNTAIEDEGTTAGPGLPLNTYRTFAPEISCPNQGKRTGPSAFLPDCRAYEMVSPLEKNGGDILPFPGIAQSVMDGGKVFYEANPSFGDAQNSWFGNQYVATRNDSGWPGHGIHPPVEGDRTFEFPGPLGLINDTLAHTPDLCSTWFLDYLTPPYTSEGQEGFNNLYRRDNCGAGEGEMEALTPDPPALDPETEVNYVLATSLGGVSEDGTLALFAAEARLPHAPEAATGKHSQLYARHCPSAATEICGAGHPEEGEVKLVSVLPGGGASASDSAAGNGWRRPNLASALSADGERVYWSTGGLMLPQGIGSVYLRLHPEQGEVGGECTDNATIACTIAVSGGSSAAFQAAARDGSRAIYTEGEELWEFDLTRQEAAKAPASRPIAAGVIAVAGASEDLSRVYFVSREAIPESGQDSKGDEAAEGAPNLYLYEPGDGEAEPAYAFVVTLGEEDVNVEGTAYSPRISRTSPDGERLLFLSRARLTGYDNTDAIEPGKADAELFAYGAESGELLCISCNPSGARPRGRELTNPYWKTFPAGHGVFAAAWIPAPERPLYASRLVSADGERIVFNSNDALLPRDANGTMDVYQWEATGKGTCEESSPTYFPQNGGCLDLVSAGQSSFESQVWEADADGSDVFFSTESNLVAPDTGLVDLYDARVGGGFEYPVPPPICEGEACQSPPGAPEFPAPASGSYRGPGKAARPKPKKRCTKGRRKVRRHGKTLCVKRRRGRAHANRRAAR